MSWRSGKVSLCGGGGRGYDGEGRFDGEVKWRDFSGGYRGSREVVFYFLRWNWKKEENVWEK